MHQLSLLQNSIDIDHSNSWYSTAQNDLRGRVSRSDMRGPAKNVIVFIGDGMDLTTVSTSQTCT